MTWKKVCRILLAVMLVALTILLAAAAVRIWLEGSARKAEDPLAAVYTPENVAQALARVRPLLWAVIGMTATGLVLDIGEERGARPLPPRRAERKAPASRPAAAAAGKSPERGTAAVQIVLLLAAGVLIVLGILNGSLHDVLLKAINICSECIGLG